MYRGYISWKMHIIAILLKKKVRECFNCIQYYVFTRKIKQYLSLRDYSCFQLFLHKVFGYRGIILFPWVARVYDRDREIKDTERYS